MLYTPVSVLVGLILIFDAVHLLRENGKASKISSVASTVEVVWLVISLIYLFSEELYGLKLLVPILFVSYVIAGFISSFLMVRELETPEEIQELKVPRPFMVVALIFGLLFSLANILVLII
ncbi:MAG: hypothetical protein LAT84_08490 [Balneolia bacterium]|nr:hypothetical protein [Balneolia bacterium]